MPTKHLFPPPPKTEKKNKTPLCPICKDSGLVDALPIPPRTDGQFHLDGWVNLRELLCCLRPCPVCAAGEKERTLRQSWLEDWQEPFAASEVLL